MVMARVYGSDFLRSRLSQLLYVLQIPLLLAFGIALFSMAAHGMDELTQDGDSRAVVAIKEINASPDAHARVAHSPRHKRERTFAARSSSHGSLSTAQAEKIELAIQREERRSAHDNRTVGRGVSAQSAHSPDGRRSAASLLDMPVNVDEVLADRESSRPSGGVGSKKSNAIESAQAAPTQRHGNPEPSGTGSVIYNTDYRSLFGEGEDPELATQKFRKVGDEVLAMLSSEEYGYSPDELAAVCSSLESTQHPAMRFFEFESPVYKGARHRRVNAQTTHTLRPGSRDSEEKDNARDIASFNDDDQSMHREVLTALLRELAKKDRKEKIEAQKAKSLSHQLLVKHKKESNRRKNLDHVAKFFTGLVAAGIGAWASKCQSGK